MHQNSTARATFRYSPGLCVHCTLRRYKYHSLLIIHFCIRVCNSQGSEYRSTRDPHGGQWLAVSRQRRLTGSRALFQSRHSGHFSCWHCGAERGAHSCLCEQQQLGLCICESRSVRVVGRPARLVKDKYLRLGQGSVSVQENLFALAFTSARAARATLQLCTVCGWEHHHLTLVVAFDKLTDIISRTVQTTCPPPATSQFT